MIKFQPKEIKSIRDEFVVIFGTLVLVDAASPDIVQLDVSQYLVTKTGEIFSCFVAAIQSFS